MDYNEIRKLLEKYWAAETDLSEETYLKNFFINTNNIPDDLLADRHLFMTYEEDKNFPKLNADLTTKLKKRLSNNTIPFYMSALKYAAVFLLLVISYTTFIKKRSPSSSLVIEATIKDKKDITKEVNAALTMLSVNMKDGLTNIKQLEILKDISKEIHETQKQKR